MTVSSTSNGLPIRALAEVLENRDEGGGGFRLTLSVADWPGALPGQFVMLSAGVCTDQHQLDPLLPRPMAVYQGHRPAVPGETAEVSILFKATGVGTRLLAEASPGQHVRVVGPLGGGFPEPRPNQRVVLVGGGTGTASLYEWAAQCAATHTTTVVLGARSQQELIGRADFEGLGVDLRLATEDGSQGVSGRVTAVLEPLLAEAGRGEVCVYACGPTPMMKACSDLAAAAGMACVVSLENNMACGFGVCLGCAVPMAEGGFSLVCRSGPIYQAEAIDWAGLP